MGRDLAAAFAAAREVFQEVDETLKQKLSKLMFEGPAEELTLTENTQPALMAHSLAVLRVLEREGGTTLQRKALVVAGHSLGEYSALGRGRGVHRAGRGAPAEAARPGDAEGGAGRHGRDGGPAGRRHGAGRGNLRRSRGGAGNRQQREVVQPANDNGGGQVVISGHRTAIERAIEIAKTKGVKRAMLLPVSAPFHCALMAPAADAMAEALENTAARRAVRAAGGECLGQTRIRSWANPRPAGTAGDRHGALARMRRGDDRDGGRPVSSNLAPARC